MGSCPVAFFQVMTIFEGQGVACKKGCKQRTVQFPGSGHGKRLHTRSNASGAAIPETLLTQALLTQVLAPSICAVRGVRPV